MKSETATTCNDGNATGKQREERAQRRVGRATVEIRQKSFSFVSRLAVSTTFVTSINLSAAPASLD